jgi:hypothetical protein
MNIRVERFGNGLDFHDNCVFQPHFLGLKFLSFQVYKACQLHFLQLDETLMCFIADDDNIFHLEVSLCK